MKIPKLVKESVVFSNWWHDIIEKIYKDWDKEANILSLWKNKDKTGWNNAVCVIVVDTEWNIVLIDEYKMGISKSSITGILWGGAVWLTSLENAKKEMLEEIWYKSDKINHLWTLNSNSYVLEEMDLFIALDSKEDKKSGPHGELEVIEDFKVSLEKFNEMILSWEIMCPYTISAYHLAKAKNLI